MLLLGIDLGTSSVKVTVLNAATQQRMASVQYPETEADIIAMQQISTIQIILQPLALPIKCMGWFW